MIEKHWDKILTVTCLILTGVVEAFNQAVAGSPKLASVLPDAFASPKMHFVPLMLLIAAGTVWLVGRSRHKPMQEQKQIQMAAQAIAVNPGVNFNFDNYFRLSHTSQLTTGTANDVKGLVAQQHPHDREDTLAKFIGIGFWAYSHDMTWAQVYKSQLLTLTDLNSRGGYMPLSDARGHYDKAVPQHPDIYPAYSFDDWLNFMKREQLLIQHPSNMLEITTRGRDFLKYLTHWGRSADQRRG